MARLYEKKVEDFTVIIGCGALGARLADEICLKGGRVLIVDVDQDAFLRLDNNSVCETVTGDGTDVKLLEKAGLSEAACVLAATGDDKTNILAAEIAREIFGIQKVIARMNDPARAKTYELIGIPTVSPTLLAASAMEKMAN